MNWKRRGFRAIGTIGVLEAAAGLDRIDLHESFEKMKTSDFWVSPTSRDERLRLYCARIKSTPPEAASRGQGVQARDALLNSLQ
jgi:hypothetical protein